MKLYLIKFIWNGENKETQLYTFLSDIRNSLPVTAIITDVFEINNVTNKI